jgi:hypothetical protein
MMLRRREERRPIRLRRRRCCRLINVAESIHSSGSETDNSHTEDVECLFLGLPGADVSSIDLAKKLSNVVKTAVLS